MNAADLSTAKALLSALGQAEASRLINDPRDLNEFLISNRLELDQTELQELKVLYK